MIELATVIAQVHSCEEHYKRQVDNTQRQVHTRHQPVFGEGQSTHIVYVILCHAGVLFLQHLSRIIEAHGRVA